MQKNNVISIRKRFHMNKNYALRIIVDQVLIFDERTSCIIWDDENAVLYAFNANPIRDTNGELPSSIRAIEYESIVEIDGFFVKEDLAAQFDSFITKGLTNKETKDAVIDEIFNVRDVRMYIDGNKQDPVVMHHANPKFDRATATNVVPYAEKLELNNSADESNNDDSNNG